MQAARRLFVGGNWKCNGTLATMSDLVTNVLNPLDVDFSKVQVVVAPVSIHLQAAKQVLDPRIELSAQNSSATGQGAFTGEIAPEQLTEMGIPWTIIGHSERRSIYGETDEIVAQKVKNAQNSGLNVIACIGENLQERESGVTLDVVAKQLNAIKDSVGNWGNLVLAYEPVWAIGTGKVATPEQAQEVHAMIRNWLKDGVSHDVSNATRIIYGGSVTDQNCSELIRQQDIDGFLVGGASLKPAFKTIVETCSRA